MHDDLSARLKREELTYAEKEWEALGIPVLCVTHFVSAGTEGGYFELECVDDRCQNAECALRRQLCEAPTARRRSAHYHAPPGDADTDDD